MNKDNLYTIRHFLHKNPELSLKEKKTAEFLIQKLEKYSPTKIIKNVGGFGIVAVFDSKRKGKTIAYRTDMDALPIQEENDINYHSLKNNVAHLCGHDGHMTILLGLAEKISQEIENLRGKIILIFQPAEEIAAGAKAMLNDKKFQELHIDYIFGLHNIPGYKKGAIILKENVFASGSTGFIARFFGKTSHAAHPENGKSPVNAMVSTINYLQNLVSFATDFNDSNLITIIHSKLGEIAFGTTPGYAEVMATIRSFSNQDIDKMIKKINFYIENLALAHNLIVETELIEYFSAVMNDSYCTKLIKKVVKENKISFLIKENPFPWSEDFGFFLEEYKGAFFGLGSGKEQPQLHNPNYDFPDEIIETGISVFQNIYKEIMNEEL